MASESGTDPEGVRPLDPRERELLLLGFDKLYHSGFYDDRAAAAAAGGRHLVCSYADIIEALRVQEDYDALTVPLDMPGLPEFTDVEEYLAAAEARRKVPERREVLFVLDGEPFEFRRGTLGFYLAGAAVACVRWSLHGLGRLSRSAARLRRRETKPRTRPGDFTEDELAVLSRKYAFVPLPELCDGMPADEPTGRPEPLK